MENNPTTKQAAPTNNAARPLYIPHIFHTPVWRVLIPPYPNTPPPTLYPEHTPNTYPQQHPYPHPPQSNAEQPHETTAGHRATPTNIYPILTPRNNMQTTHPHITKADRHHSHHHLHINAPISHYLFTADNCTPFQKQCSHNDFPLHLNIYCSTTHHTPPTVYAADTIPDREQQNHICPDAHQRTPPNNICSTRHSDTRTAPTIAEPLHPHSGQRTATNAEPHSTTKQKPLLFCPHLPHIETKAEHPTITPQFVFIGCKRIFYFPE